MQLLFAVVVFYFILGMFMETLPMMVATVPIIAPIMFKVGFDPVWFGVLIIILMELAMITPPVGINLYVVQGLHRRGRSTTSLSAPPRSSSPADNDPNSLDLAPNCAVVAVDRRLAALSVVASGGRQRRKRDAKLLQK